MEKVRRKKNRQNLRLFLVSEGIYINTKRFLGFVHSFIFSARVKGDDLITINRCHRHQMTVRFDFSSESK